VQITPYKNKDALMLQERLLDVAYVLINHDLVAAELRLAFEESIGEAIPKLTNSIKQLLEALHDTRRRARLGIDQFKLWRLAVTWKHQGSRSRWTSKASLDLWDYIDGTEKRNEAKNEKATAHKTTL